MPDSVLHKSNKIAVVQPTNMTKVCVIYSRWKNFDLFKFLKPCPTWLMVADSVQDSFSNSKSADDPISVGLWYRLPQWSLLIFAFSYSSWSSQGKNVQVACHSLLQWTTFCQNCPPWPVHFTWPYMAWFIVSLSYTRLWSMWSSWLVFCDCHFPSVCSLMDVDRGLCKFPDGRNCLSGKLSLALIGGAMFIKL